MSSCFLCAASATAQPVTPPIPKLSAVATPIVEESAGWKLDRVELKNGRVFEGVIETESEEFLELLEVRRPTGKPMYLLVRPVERKLIKDVRRLSDVDREVLLKRLSSFLNRANAEEKRLRALELKEHIADGKSDFTFSGFARNSATKDVWFTLESTADDDATRRAIVRIEQAFVVFRQFFPARVNPPSPPHFVLLGTMEEYADQLRKQKLHIKNPAYYSSDQNRVVAGSDLSRYAGQLALTRSRHEQLHQEYTTLGKQMPDLLKDLTRDLDKQGFPLDERKKIIIAAQGRWDRDLATLEKRIRTAERMNSALFDEVANEMFARLYHEAFHAYLDNYLFPRDRNQVPRWLNEGCAQMFESGLWEGEMLRLDAPHPRLLPRLQAALTEKEPLTIAQVLSADPKEFLASHDLESANAGRYYAYSWGLAYYLLVDQPPLSTASLSAYSTFGPEIESDPIKRFEALVGRPLEKFEYEWRERMLSLK